MYTLSSYDLKPGDWVKFSAYGWQEFERLENGYDHYFYVPHEFSRCFGAGVSVGAVLRPSVIIRHMLDTMLKETRFRENGDFSQYKLHNTFTEIHPRKEEAKSIEIQTVLSDLKALYWQGDEMKRKLDEIEKILIDKN